MFSKRCAVTLAVVTALVPCGPAWAAAPNGFAAAVIEAAGAAKPANADVVYQVLRGSLPGGEGVKVKGLTLERQGGIFHFDDGSFYFYGPVNGRVSGAVFLGTGHFDLSVKDASEQHSLARLTKSGVMTQAFTTVVLRFTDGTAEEIRKASVGSAGATPSQAGSVAVELARGFRKKLQENFELRLLSDVIAGREGEFFLASFRMGGAFTGRNVLFVVDPMGTFDAAPDQVELSTWDEDGSQIWAAYRMAGKEGRGEPGDEWHVVAESLDVAFEKSGAMKASAEATLAVKQAGVRVLPLNLYPTLRVTGVFDEAGQPLDFVQEDKDSDPQFAVILKQATKTGQTLRLLVKYGGKDAVRQDGDGVYYLMPGARECWYPSGNNGFGDFADFHMTFHVPRGLEIVATGKEVSRDAEGGGTRAVWETQAPIPVAGFNLGEFKSKAMKTPDGFEISAYANAHVPDFAARIADQGLGSLSGVPALPVELSQGSAAIQIYSEFFGKLPYDHVALTQQSACNYGQSWPMLVYLPTCAFWDSTEQHEFGLLDNGGASYWKEVTAHEVSHQWWGQMVGFKSYRDQWMSEGFANFSVSLYLMGTRKTRDDYRDFWKEQHDNLLLKNQMGVRPIDVGPLTMGVRVANEKTGNVYQDLIYSKGAFVMHMLQMMYWTPKYGETPFKHSMQAFVTEYADKAATTEDLKASFEKTMPPWLNLTGDGKLDWFFNEYVYGTELPHEVLTGEFTMNGDSTTMHVKLAQSHVSSDFYALVPIYIQFANGTTVRLGAVPLRGESSMEKTVDLGKLPSAAKKLVLNYNYDLLTD